MPREILFVRETRGMTAGTNVVKDGFLSISSRSPIELPSSASAKRKYDARASCNVAGDADSSIESIRAWSEYRRLRSR